MSEIKHAIKDDRWHILNRPGMYIGSVSAAKKLEYMVSSGKIQEESIVYVPALIKMGNEIIDNSIDILKNLKNGKIDIIVTKNSITTKDNGPGIPLDTIKDLNDKDVLIPYSCWGLAKSGSNFGDDEDTKTTIGTNGVGSYCTNVHSDEFTGITRNGTQIYTGKWSNNALEYKEEIISKKCTPGTEVVFKPKLSTFNIQEIDDSHKRIIHQRLLNLSVVYPNISFTFNGKAIKLNRKQYLKLFNDEGEIFEDTTGKYAIGVFPNRSDDFKQFSIINGLNIKSGNHIDYLLDYIIEEIKEKLPKKFEGIKPGDIKNKLQIVMIGANFPEIQWEGQTKETIGNSNKDVRNYLGEEWKPFVTRIANNKTIQEEITFLYQAKLDAEEKKNAANADKELKKVKVLKLRKASKWNKIFILTEGDSALKGIIKALGREYHAFYPMKGVGLNVETNKNSKIITNAEYKDIMSALGFTFAGPNSCLNMNYNYVAIAADADVDGSHITGLILAFFKKYCPDIFTHKRLLILRTPIKVAKDKKENMVKAFLTEEEYKAYKRPKNVDIEYKKGLGSMNDKEYKQFFSLRPLNDCLCTIDCKEDDFGTMQSWVAEDTDYRKEKIQELMASGQFDLDTL